MPAKRRKAKHKPRFTRQQRETVTRLIAAGASQVEMGKAVGATPKTIKRHFATQLEDAKRADGVRGRKPRVWSDEERGLVGLVVALGLQASDIANMLSLTLVEFQRAFADELLTSKAKLDARMGIRLVEEALGGDGGLMRFYLRARANWNDRRAPELAPPPQLAEASQLRDLIGALDAEGRAAYRVVLEQMAARSPLSPDAAGPGDSVN
jgi:hypothetical protein